MMFKDIGERFLKIEDELDLFNEKIRNVYFWERVRFVVHIQILADSGIFDLPYNLTKPKITNRALGWIRALKNLVFKNPYFSSHKEILIWGCSRRKLQEDGKYWDIYYDPVIEGLDKSFIYLESLYQRKHFIPTKTKDVRYLDFFQNVIYLKRRLGLLKIHFSEREERLLKSIEEEIYSKFEVSIKIKKIVKQELLVRSSMLPFYIKLLRRIKPAVVLLNNSYGKETFIEACKNLYIPTIELQHGVLNKYSFGYSYPGEKRKKRTFPDYFFAFGDFWKNSVELPINKNNVYSVGYPYLEQQKEKYSKVKKKEQILFVSQITIGKELSKYAFELAKHDNLNYKIIYKLHPGEYRDWKESYPWLVGSKIEVIDNDSISFYKLLAESKIQIGVYSTALYEGLTFNLRTYLVNLPGIENIKPLVENNYGILISSFEELHNAILEGESLKEESINTDKFFKSDALKNIYRGINKIINIE